MGETPLLEVRGLSVQYRRRHATIQALDGVSFEVRPGETVGLVGESGSGKSTVGRAILGLTPVQAGSIRFAGKDVTHAGFEQRRALYRHVQIVFQDPYSSLNPSRTIGRTLAEPLEAYGERDRAVIAARVHAMLERVQLPLDAADRYPRQFSGGQRQRIAIARALMLTPQLVICDEPVSALDLSVQAQIVALLQELQTAAGLSYLFISHDLDLVRHLCDRVIVLYKGTVMETGRADRLSDAPAHPYTDALQAAAPSPNPRLQRQRRARLARLRPSVAPGATADAGCPFAPRCPHAEERCWTERPVLRASKGDGLVACHRYPEWRGAEAGPVPCAQALACLESLPETPPMWERAIDELRREAREEALVSNGALEPVATVEEIVADGVAARLYRPTEGERDVLVWIHGGAWMLGDLDSYEPVARALANRAACAVLSVDHRLAPEHRYPAAIDDAWAATRWAAERFDAIAVGGDSTGGNLAAAVALRARDCELELALQLLVYPVLDCDLDTPFHVRYRERYGRFAGCEGFGARFSEEIRYAWATYVPDPARRLEPDASPLRAASLRGVAPALLITAEHDILRGENEAYARRLEADGVAVEVHDYPGQIHGFFGRLGAMDDARDAVDRAAAALRRAFCGLSARAQ